MKINNALMIILLLTNTLVACSSVPLTTMLRLSSFDEQSLLTIKPSDIRAKITINDFIDIDLANTKLGLDLESSTGSLSLQFPLEKLTLTKNSAKSSFFSSTPASHTYLLQLSDEALIDFKKLQRKLQASEKNSFGVSINAQLKKNLVLTAEQKAQTVFITIEIKLYETEEFFTLIEQAEIDYGKSEL